MATLEVLLSLLNNFMAAAYFIRSLPDTWPSCNFPSLVYFLFLFSYYHTKQHFHGYIGKQCDFVLFCASIHHRCFLKRVPLCCCRCMLELVIMTERQCWPAVVDGLMFVGNWLWLDVRRWIEIVEIMHGYSCLYFDLERLLI